MAQALGWLILLATFAGAVFAASSGLRRRQWERRRFAEERDFFTVRLRAFGDAAERERAVAGAWAGYRKFAVVRRKLETADVCSFFFKPHDGRPLPPFLAGQFLTFRLLIGERRVVRCYSLSAADEYRVTIKRIAPGGRGAPPGEVSSFFHDRVSEGDILDIAAPAGVFTLQASAGRPLVMIAGGVGITPFLAMLSRMAADGDMREAWLFYGVRDRAGHIAADRLRALAGRLPNLKTFVLYSAPRAGEQAHCDFVGRIQTARIRALLPSSNYEFYLCGPPAMIDDLVGGLKDWGVPHSSLRYEAFGRGSVKRRKAGPAADGFNVVFAKSAVTARWTEEQGSILDLCEKNGIAAEFGCRAGNCRACLASVREGAVRYISRLGAEVEAGSCLICCAVPDGDVTIDL